MRKPANGFMVLRIIQNLHELLREDLRVFCFCHDDDGGVLEDVVLVFSCDDCACVVVQFPPLRYGTQRQLQRVSSEANSKRCPSISKGESYDTSSVRALYFNMSCSLLW